MGQTHQPLWRYSPILPEPGLLPLLFTHQQACSLFDSWILTVRSVRKQFTVMTHGWHHLERTLKGHCPGALLQCQAAQDQGRAHIWIQSESKNLPLWNLHGRRILNDTCWNLMTALRNLHHQVWVVLSHSLQQLTWTQGGPQHCYHLCQCCRLRTYHQFHSYLWSLGWSLTPCHSTGALTITLGCHL